MAFTKVVGAGIHTQSNIDSHNINSTGIITATKFVGPITGGGGDFNAGIVTCTELDVNGNGDISGNLVVGGNLTANGDFTTLNTTLREVELLRVDAQDDNVAAGIITQRGAGDIFSVYDTSTEVFKIADGGRVFIGETSAAGGAKLVIGNGGAENFEFNSGMASSYEGGVLEYIHRGDGNTRPNLNFYVNNTGKHRFWTAGSERLTIAADGTVGIGSTIPLSAMALDVVGSIRYSNQSRGANGSEAEPSYAFYADHDTGMYRGGTNILSFSTNGSQRLKIDADGAVSVLETGDNKGLRIHTNSGVSATNNELRFNTGQSGGFTFMTNSDGTNTNERLRIASDGDVTFGTGMQPGAAVNIISDKNVETDADDMANYHLVLKNPQNDTGEAIGLAFGITDTVTKVGAAIVHERDSAGSQGSLKFFTRPSNAGPPSERLSIGSDGKLTVTSPSNLFTSNSYNILEFRADDNNDDNNSDIILKFTHDGTFRSEIRYDESSSTLELSTSDNRDDFSMDTDGKVTFKKDIATAQDYPNYRPTLDFNFAAEKVLDPRISYSRSGSASFINEFGKVVLVGANAPRFDHVPETRECKGLLIEESRTNLLYPSSNWSSTYWSLSAVTAEINTTDTEDPAGTFTASKLIPIQGNTALKDIHWASSSLTFANGTKYAASVFAKSTTGLVLQLRPRGQGSNKAWVNYNLSTGTIGNYGGTTLLTKEIEKYPNGWYRCSLTFTGSGNSGAGFGTLIMDDDTDTEGVAHTGDSSKSLYLWGAQHEEGAFPTSYIPTYNIASETRGDDDLIIDGEDLTDFHNQPEGTIFADYKVIGGDPDIFYLSNNTASRRIGLYEAGSSQTRFIIGNSGTQSDTTDSAGTTVGDNIKAAGAYKLNDVAASKNGVISGTDTNATIPDDIDRAYIGGYYDGTVEGVLGLRRLVYYQQRLPNSQLVTLTA